MRRNFPRMSGFTSEVEMRPLLSRSVFAVISVSVAFDGDGDGDDDDDSADNDNNRVDGIGSVRSTEE